MAGLCHKARQKRACQQVCSIAARREDELETTDCAISNYAASSIRRLKGLNFLLKFRQPAFLGCNHG